MSLGKTSSVLDLKTPINKLVMSQIDNRVNLFVASLNHLYKIVDDEEEDVNSGGLRIDIDLMSGPKSMKSKCAFTPTSSANQCVSTVCDGDSRQQIQLVDNENRLLLVDSLRGQLIECGTVDYGGCRLRRLNDLTVIGCNYSAPVIPFNSASGVIVSTGSNDRLLYLMVSIENDPSKRLDITEFPVFSVRNLGTENTPRPNRQSSPKLQLFQLKYPNEHMNYDQTLFDSDFHMNIIYSFKHNGYVYFLYTITYRVIAESCNGMFTASANNQTTSSIVTRLLRIYDTTANKNPNFNDNSEPLTNLPTISELVLDCENRGVKYHILQSAHFESGNEASLFMAFNTTSTSSVTPSAVCPVKISKLDEHFSQLVSKCLEGRNNYLDPVSPYSNKNTWKTPCRCSMILDYIKKSGNLEILSNQHKIFLHNDYLSYMSGRQALSLSAVQLDFESRAGIGAIAATKSGDKTVLIAATQDNQVHLSVYHAETNKASKYDKIDLTSLAPSLSHYSNHISIAINDNPLNSALYLTSNNFLFKLSLQNCAKFKTCDSCVGVGAVGSANPFCGWCVYEQRCSARHQCSDLWLNEKSGECPIVTRVMPSIYVNPASSRFDDVVSVDFNFKLSTRFGYHCEFGIDKTRVIAQINQSMLTCDLAPVKAKFLKLSQQEPIRNKFLNLTLELRTEQKTLLGATVLKVFNCSNFMKCSECVSEELSGGCVWCGRSSRCLFSSDTSCISAGIINTDQCTRIVSNQRKLEIAFSSDTSIAQISPSIFIRQRHSAYQTRFKCLFTTSGDDKGIESDLSLDSEGRIDCPYSPHQQLKFGVALQTVYLSVWWTMSEEGEEADWSRVELEDSQFDLVELSVINCQVKASSCGECMSKQLLDLGCGWCAGTFESKCSMRKDCRAKWINDFENDYCSGPLITHITPKCGPKQNAGTQLTITGHNLGKSSHDVKVMLKPMYASSFSSGHLVDDIDCIIVSEMYARANRIVCRTRPIVTSPKASSLILKTQDEFSVYVLTNTRNPTSVYSSFNTSSHYVFKYIVSAFYLKFYQI